MNNLDEMPIKCQDCPYWEYAEYPYVCYDCEGKYWMDEDNERRDKDVKEWYQE